MGSGGGGGSGNPALLSQNAAPMPNIPIAGQGSDIDPANYGTFQSFLPELISAAQAQQGMHNPMATGITSDMLTFKAPDGKVDPGLSGQVNDLRSQLAALQAAKGNGQGNTLPDLSSANFAPSSNWPNAGPSS